MWPLVLKSPTQGQAEEQYGLTHSILQENIEKAKLMTCSIAQSCKMLKEINYNTNISKPSVFSPVSSSIIKLN